MTCNHAITFIPLFLPHGYKWKMFNNFHRDIFFKRINVLRTIWNKTHKSSKLYRPHEGGAVWLGRPWHINPQGELPPEVDSRERPRKYLFHRKIDIVHMIIHTWTLIEVIITFPLEVYNSLFPFFLSMLIYFHLHIMTRLIFQTMHLQ